MPKPIAPNPKVCRWCGNEGALVDAHIIPKAFYRPIITNATKRAVVMLSPEDRYYKQELQSGVFDPGILCTDCDGGFGLLDDFAARVFRNPPKPSQAVFEGIGYNLGCKDLNKVKRFFLSIMWRASVTSRDFFKTARLGETQENKIKALLVGGEPLPADLFESMIIHYPDAPIKGGFSPPWVSEFESIETYNLYLPFYTIRIRLDQRPWPMAIAQFCLGRIAGLDCLRLHFAGSLEERMQNSVLAKTQLRRTRRR